MVNIIMVLKTLLIFIFSFNCFAEVSNVGEKNFDDYYGPADPNYMYDPYKNQINFIDNWIQESSLTQKISHEVNSLESFFTKEFVVGAYCPQNIYEKYENYIQYLYRIQVLSYLFQSLREHAYLSQKFSFKTNCDVDWGKLIKQCRAKTIEMKNFTHDAQIAFKELPKITVPFSESSKKQYTKWIQGLISKKPVTLTQYRLLDQCKNCRYKSKHVITKNINAICEQEKKLFHDICHENDRLYGASSVPEVYHLIVRSSGVRGINQEGHAGGCLKRFTEEKKSTEFKHPILKNIFSVLFDYNMARSPLYPQGRLFSIGSIKEFTDKGLAGVFRPIKVAKKAPVVKEIVTPMVSMVNPEFEEIVLPEVIIKSYKKTTEVKKKKALPKKKILKRSSFFITSEFREKYKLDQVEVDLIRFHYDYIFSLTAINELSPVIQKFSEIKSLRSMKNLDKLGSKKSPVPLRFLKFLIERKSHQSLFNMIQVLGDKFFIYNDIDEGVRKIDFITLINNESTDFKWKLYILKP